MSAIIAGARSCGPITFDAADPEVMGGCHRILCLAKIQCGFLDDDFRGSRAWTQRFDTR